ncbi:hypothetical protein [Streptomyces sp. KL2]|uniref:hypothetical protein n=1 Tax=Streptomyces sp. KL2 TaxID=3050126 RepID=UPI00397DF244
MLYARTAALAAIAAAASTALAAATYSKATGPWSLSVSRHQIRLLPTARRDCPDCRGNGGWWIGGPFPEMEACRCWAGRLEMRIPLLRRPNLWLDEPPF